MEYLPRVPDGEPLAGPIEVLFSLDGYSPDHVRERIVPNGRMTLVLELDGRPRHTYDNESGRVLETFRDAWLSGVQERYITIGETRPENKLMAVQFAPGGSMAFTHRPASDFRNTVVSGESVFGRSILELRQRILSSADPERRLETLESWLVGRFDATLSAPAHLARAIGRMVRGPADARIADLAAGSSGVSSKHFIDLFRRYVGTTPKVFQRILRFSRIFEALQRSEEVSWAELSAELGYADQSHLHHEFRLFSGYRPGEFRDRNDDRVNFFADEGP